MEDVKKITPKDIYVAEEWILLFGRTYSRIPLDESGIKWSIAAVLAAIANDPPMLTDEKYNQIQRKYMRRPYSAQSCHTEYMMKEWLQTCFLKQEPEVPKEIKELVKEWRDLSHRGLELPLDDPNGLAMKLYNLGKASK